MSNQPSITIQCPQCQARHSMDARKVRFHLERECPDCGRIFPLTAFHLNEANREILRTLNQAVSAKPLLQH